ncbi:hypothetical protein Purlil1_11644 [Purpureocillium lilacinum]|uniref:Cytochrome b mRNA-processing protein 4 n=1 Tax=Purpureocillium lilacinum TaxID=33203 RepID=A0ABR0BJC5_PURLI|nr:hypothetical protein Purlil1_11644 [Purpureocillium lilacinum]
MPPKKPVNWRLWTKVLIGYVSRTRPLPAASGAALALAHRPARPGAAVSIGGPALTWWLTPTEEQLRARYNPDLLKKSIEQREEREQEFDEFVTKLKEYSKSDKPTPVVAVWIVVKEEEERKRKAALRAGKAQQREAEAQREEMRREAGLGSK